MNGSKWKGRKVGNLRPEFDSRRPLDRESARAAGTGTDERKEGKEGTQGRVPSIEKQWMNAAAATDEGWKRGEARLQRTTS
ncbi:hypothetical protein R1sor_026369 [Riccia sorocarpa]|uniref:Uncharacterized protein n=1 Tax=Riccia sorocarpa TaxID=122646 RepID=A0ABD3GEV5_9MARC